MIITNIPMRDPIELPAFYQEFEWYYPNCEMDTKKWFVEHAEKDWVYIDCGANIGYYSILFSQISPAGHVYSIEPTNTFNKLKINIDHNKCKNITPKKLALGSSSGSQKEKIFRIWGQPAEEMEYEFITIDSLVDCLQLKKLDCLKIDVDSFDFEVLKGAEKVIEEFDPWIVVELNHALAVRGQSNMAAIEWLINKGYNQALVLDYDNFILKRSNQELKKIGSFEISFEGPKKLKHSLEDCFKGIVPSVQLKKLDSLFPTSSLLPPVSSAKKLDEWVMEECDAPIFSYIYKVFNPKRHLEFGTWQGWGTKLCLDSCGATVWTINLPNGEDKSNGEWAYGERVQSLGEAGSGLIEEVFGDDESGQIIYRRTDAGSSIGRYYREANLGGRVNQIYCDSTEWSTEAYAPDFFDSVLIDGGHDASIVISDTIKALSVLRSGGIIMWHDFCPAVEIREKFDSVRGVTAGISKILPKLKDQLETLVWIEPSWILLGIKK